MASVFHLKSAAVLSAGLLVAAAGLGAQNGIPGDDVTRESLRFTAVYDAVEAHYVETVDPDRALFDGAIRGMLSTLDPFSNFFDPDQFEMLQQQARGEGVGFGSILYVQTGKVVVLETAQGSPSWRAGLGPGDEIVEVNGTRINRLDFESLIDLLRKARSGRVRLGIIHPGQLVAHDVVMNPAEIALPTVDKAYLLSGGIAYVHLASFEQRSAQEIVDAVHKMEGSPGDRVQDQDNAKGQVKRMLLDLRDNPGGIVDSAVSVASLFLKPGLTVITVRGRNYPEKIHKTTASPVHFDFPLVVLVNGNTASAAEVLASALQDHDRALIVGEPTFGKGVVESVVGLDEKTGLALTTAQYLTASGRCLQRPLPRTALASLQVQDTTKYHTDGGRPVSAGGGVTPDFAISSRQLDPWAAFLDQRGIFTTYASGFLASHGRIEGSFVPDDKVLSDFKEYLGRSGIRAPQQYWAHDQDYLKLRIKTEVLTLTRGLQAGEEIAVRNDPQVEEASRLFARIQAFLKPVR